VVSCKKAKVHEELVAGIGKEVATNKNGLGVELESKNSKDQSTEIRWWVCARKMTRL
jgi:hypothetical protein